MTCNQHHPQQLPLSLIYIYPQPTPMPPPAPAPTPSGCRSVTLMCLSVCLGAFVFAYNTVCLTMLADLLQAKNHLSHDQLVRQLSIATSCFNLGAFISPILYRKYVDKLGEVRGLLLIDIVGIVAIIAEMTVLQFYVLAGARLVLGFIIGISTAIIPVYINSLAPPSMLGKLGSYNQLLQTLGVVCAYVAGYLVDGVAVDDQFRWRLFLGLPLVFLLVRIVVLQCVYKFDVLERYINRGERTKLQQYCRLVYGNDEQPHVQAVIDMKNSRKAALTHASTWRRRFAVALVVIASNQLSGTNSILYYAKQLFSKVADGSTSYSQTLIVLLSVLQVLATLISTQVVDRFGRKKMILRGQAFILICLLGIVVSDKLVAVWVGKDAGTIGVVFLIFAHVTVMNMTLGPCCIIYCAEIVEDITWIIITLKGLSLLIALTTEYMIEYLGLGFMFLIFFCLTLLAHVFIRPRVVETKGLSTGEIYAAFGARNPRPLEQNTYESIIEGQ